MPPDFPPRCNLFVIRASNLDAAEIFYQALGLQFDRHAHGAGPIHLATETPGQVFEIYPLSSDDSPTTSARVGFAVADVDATYTALLEAGGSSVSSPRDSPWGRRAVVADPDGHRVEITA
ncbi:VOC family protein [Blastopirellula retiformator]|uniref:Glyoxalase-like domain protein n=1 Tax=Blastopirellula retiformator TaxID=2527970 RepID=A0A5C5VJT3_9BACT|nr:VOC family protein [Blastopirellula retiformator]TWT38864.1 Glyoxalase-like domain protein [Blastopirellula retiformator]